MSQIKGRIDDQNRVLMPLILVASDGNEVEVESTISLEFDGYLAVDEQLAVSLGWRSLGGRQVAVGFETRILDHYLGTVYLGQEAKNVVVLGGINRTAVIGQKLLSGKMLTVSFTSGEVTLS